MENDIKIKIEFLGTVRNLLTKKPNLLDENTDEVRRLLDVRLPNDSEEIDHMTQQVLECFQQNPEALQKLRKAMGMKKSVFGPIPGKAGPIPPVYMVCPIEPNKCSGRLLRKKGQRLFCPKHNVEMVPKDSLSKQG